MSIVYGTLELVYELPMSAVSGGVGLGAGVGRGAGVGLGREVGTAPLAATAPMAKMRTANAALINFVSVFICFFLSLFFYEICRAKFAKISINVQKPASAGDEPWF